MVIEKVVALRQDDLFRLLFYHKVSLSVAFFKPSRFYLFFNQNEIHGIFLCLSVTNGEALFKHNGFKKCYYYPSNGLNSTMAYYLLRQENKPRVSLSITCFKKNGVLSLFHHSFENQRLIEGEVFTLTKEIEDILSHLESLPSLQNSSIFLESLKRKGKYLYNHLPHTLKDLMERSSHLVLRGDYLDWFYFLYNQNNFLCQRKKILEHGVSSHPPKPLLPTLEYRCISNTHRQDNAMLKEYLCIQEAFKKANIPLQTYQGHLDKINLSNFIEQSDVLHYIGHGENHSLLLEEGRRFGVEDLKTLSRVPQLLILSSCQSVDEHFIDEFFRLGGRTLIYFRQNIQSNGLESIFASFYWQLFFRRSNLEEIVLSLRRKLYKQNFNCFSLRLVGDGSSQFTPS